VILLHTRSEALLDFHRAFVWQRPYGLAYNYTLAALEHSLANRRSTAALFPHLLALVAAT